MTKEKWQDKFQKKGHRQKEKTAELLLDILFSEKKGELNHYIWHL